MNDAASWAEAPAAIERVAEVLADAPPDARWVQLVPTLHVRLRPDRTIEEFGQLDDRWRDWSSAKNFTPADASLVNRCRDQLAAAIGRAFHRGLSVSVTPHLDAASGPVSEWRNTFDFAPDAVVRGVSYESLLISPLAEAVAAALPDRRRVDVALCGEMGRSLFQHAAAYRALSERVRVRLKPGHARVGVALNWTDVADGLTAGPDARRLLISGGYVGVSCYGPVGVEPIASDFAATIDGFLEELAAARVEVVPTIPLVISEVGVGGTTPPRRNAGGEWPRIALAAERPWDGRGDGLADPWVRPDAVAFRRAYYDALCDFLTDARQRTPPIERAFLWSEGPWDPQGIIDRRFRDEVIVERIAGHNRASGLQSGQ